VGLYKSTDCGESWFDSNNNLPRDEDYFEISGLDINPHNHDELYINSFNRGVFVSYDGGSSWNPFSDGLQFLGYSSTNIKINPVDTSKIVMSTFGGSVWSIHRTIPDAIDDDAPVPRTITLSSYPNPFNSNTTISYSGIIGGEISMYDINGQLVRVIRVEQGQDGKVNWDGRNRAGEQLGSGVYFARAKSRVGLKTIKMVYMK
jgi:hypothetical protein